MSLSRAQLLLHVQIELDRPPGESERALRFMRESAAGLWRSAPEIVQVYGIPVALLRELREAGCGPRWMPRGHRFFYHVTEIETFLAGCPDVPVWGEYEQRKRELWPHNGESGGAVAGSTSAEAAAAARWFLDVFISQSRERSSWTRRARLTSDFRQFCVNRLGGLPLGWRNELWRTIRADSRFKIGMHRDEGRALIRTVAWFDPNK